MLAVANDGAWQGLLTMNASMMAEPPFETRSSSASKLRSMANKALARSTVLFDVLAICVANDRQHRPVLSIYQCHTDSSKQHRREAAPGHASVDDLS